MFAGSAGGGYPAAIRRAGHTGADLEKAILEAIAMQPAGSVDGAVSIITMPTQKHSFTHTLVHTETLVHTHTRSHTHAHAHTHTSL